MAGGFEIHISNSSLFAISMCILATSFSFHAHHIHCIHLVNFLYFFLNSNQNISDYPGNTALTEITPRLYRPQDEIKYNIMVSIYIRIIFAAIRQTSQIIYEEEILWNDENG